MVKDYLVAKGWITVGQEPEDWPLFAVPRSKEGMAALALDVQDYHAQTALGDPNFAERGITP